MRFNPQRFGKVIGVVDRATLGRECAKQPTEAASTTLLGLLQRQGQEPAFALPGETCRLVATRLAVYGLERMTVVDDASTRRIVGIVSLSDLVKPSLSHFDEEHKKERFSRTRRAG